jgi:hypothetical protein
LRQRSDGYECPACKWGQAVAVQVDREALAALAAKWEEHDEPPPKHSYPEASAEKDGINIGYARAAAELLALLSPEETKAAQCPENPSGHNRVTALDGDNKSLGYAHCGYCGAVSSS